MFDYSGLQATAQTLIARFGTSVTFVEVTTGAYDPATATPGESTTNHSATAVLLNYKLKDIDGTLIQSGDRIALISTTLTAVPKPGDKITIGSDTWVVVDSQPLSPGGTDLLYAAQVRK